jgi:hypothetical protein
LLAGSSVRLARDRIEADLIRHLQRVDAALFAMVMRQAGLAREITTGIANCIAEQQAGRPCGTTALATRSRRIEEKADRIAMRSPRRQAVGAALAHQGRVPWHEVDHEIEPLRALYRQVAWLGTVQDFRDVIPASSEYLAYVRPVSNETAGSWKLGEQGNEGETFGYRKLADLLRKNEHEWG